MPGASNLRDSSDISPESAEKGMGKSATPGRILGLLRDPRVAWAAALLLAALTLFCLPADSAENADPAERDTASAAAR
jgi:hypothetical protein